MTDEELRAIDDMHPNDYVHQLVAEVRRLRGLVEVAQFGYDEFCPWCGGGESQTTYSHAYGCPAFTPEGAVK